MALPQLVTALSDVRDNFSRYQAAIAKGELRDVFSYVQHWYAIQQDGLWTFAPSKFIGYAGITPSAYEKRHSDLDGRDTERILKTWFAEAPAGHPLEAEVKLQLRAFAAALGKSVNGRAKVHILKELLPGPVTSSKSASDLSSRITSSSDVLSGKPCIRGLRIRVSDILEMLAFGASRQQILDDYPYLEDGDISAALDFAARAVDHRRVKAA